MSMSQEQSSSGQRVHGGGYCRFEVLVWLIGKVHPQASKWANGAPKIRTSRTDSPITATQHPFTFLRVGLLRHGALDGASNRADAVPPFDTQNCEREPPGGSPSPKQLNGGHARVCVSRSPPA